jgi:intracellular multiplication protein IcmD
MMRKWMRVAASVIVGGLALYPVLAAADIAPVTMTAIAKNVDNTVSELATVLVDIALIAGICFILAAFFKIHQHKQNPQQVQLSQGISLLMIGAGLTLVPLLIPTASVAILGTAAKKPAQIGGSDIHSLIGSG